jgi:DNA-directed DNA polymerase III PolC
MYFPLRVHGHHSMLTGVDAPAVLVERAVALGLPGLALADVDTLAGLVDFLSAARKARERTGKPFRAIVGAEISDPSAELGRLVALVENAAGYRNLCKLVSARALGDDPGRVGANLDGPEHFRLVEQAVRHQEGLVFLADHPRLLVELHGRVDARSLFAAISPASLRTKSLERAASFGLPRNAHLGPQTRPPRRDPDTGEDESSHLEHPKTPAPAPPFPAHDLVLAARATGVATLAVPDVYCAFPSGLEDHAVRVAIKHNALLHDLPPNWKARAPAHLLAPAEMRALYADLPEVHGPFAAQDGALARTLEVGERCAFEPELGKILFPTIEVEGGETPSARLRGLAFAGARERFRPLRPEVVFRLEYELKTIERLGFAAYFLLVKQIADFARARGIPCVGRGSAADSLVAYCLFLTDADPLRYRLTFERFLNPTRRDRPDIDLDFCWRRRDEVLEHVYGLFGAERTAMIATINRCGMRSAFREAALVCGVPPAEANRWSRRLPWGTGGGASPDRNPVVDALKRTPETSGFAFDDPRWNRVLSAAARLLEAPRHYGLHPGGVVVAPGAITDFVSCQRATKGVVVTQFDKDAVEAIGLVKMDLLGNRALTTVDDCVKELRVRGIEVDLERIPEDDPATARTLVEGRTLGCFQVESPGMRNLLKQTGAKTMDDVIQAIALIRPGPAGSGMKDAYVRRFRKLEEARAPHPRLSDLLWETHGVLLYQEDVMQAASRMAGMDLAEADLLRRALQKRRRADLERLATRFVEGCAEQKIARADAERVWDLVANFSAFAFCKAHAVTYGRISYRAVWLKTHHPAIYLAAFLASETGYYDPRVYVEEARRLGVPILPPDVNKSVRTFAIEGTGLRPALRIGLAQVKGLSERALASILAARPFVSLPDFLERADVHKDEAESLIHAGAFDGFDRTRPELLWRLHLLSTPERRIPRSAAGETPLDPAAIAACKSTPSSRARHALETARKKSGGWHANGLGLGNADLARGECAALFPEPETPALALPRLPDLDARTRGRLEYERLGITVHAHPTAIFACPGDARIEEYGTASLLPRSPSTNGAPDGVAIEEEVTRYRIPRSPVNPAPCADLDRFVGGRITLRGWPAATRHVRTQDGRFMRFLTLEDESGLAEVVVFPDVYERDGRKLAEFGVLCVTGTVEDQMGARTLHAERIW